MYLIPKNIKVKREIFKGFGIVEIIIIGISLLLGFMLQRIVPIFKLKIFLFSFFPLLSFLLLLPLPNGSTTLVIITKFIKYIRSQRKYKYKEYNK